MFLWRPPPGRNGEPAANQGEAGIYPSHALRRRSTKPPELSSSSLLSSRHSRSVIRREGTGACREPPPAKGCRQLSSTPFLSSASPAKDYVVVGSESGRLVILEYSREHNLFHKVNQDTSDNLAAAASSLASSSPSTPRVALSWSLYVLNRDAAARLTISSPLEAHKSNTVTYSVVGVDCGFDNPIFASIELDYSESDLDPTGQAAADAQKHLTFYELDLGLNHVSRKWSEPVDDGANLLVTVPGGDDGPSGVLVCAENFVIYKNQGHPDVHAVIPRRADLPAERGVLVVSAATHRQKSRHTSEFGNHALYQFQAIGEAEDIEASSATLMETEGGFQPVFFQPHGLKNLVRIDLIESLMPIMDMKILNLFEEETPQIFTLCGTPSAVWTVKKNANDEFDAYIVVSFVNATLVLSIGETIGEVSDSGFLDTTPSLSVSLLGDDSLMQVHPNGIRHIREDGRIMSRRHLILSVQSVSSPPESLLLLASTGGEEGAEHPASVFLNAGLQNGVLFRTVVDSVTGQLSETQPQFLGLKALANEALRIFTVERLGETFNETVVALRYTPRKFVLQPKCKHLIIIESDQGTFTAEEREAAQKECLEAAGIGENGNASNGEQMENGDGDDEKEDALPDEQYGYPKAESDRWVSCIRILDPKTGNTTCLLELQDNEAAFSICIVNFHDKEYGTLLAVGTAKELQFWPKRSVATGFIYIYRFTEEGESL
ncbi:hypothetical protein ZIOFF_023800 [Zingiber officinale]|uniref:Cleavage/polyadenylation specificity factor A subunit N-terminal domain-containing protein n=1 Tax=Zingiber officinale TaxID=94328 RepID=A0A8J5HB45_ZINOF|nr:hypothetical protein ZIOFF_023800 [Zingiber officinale]